MDTTEETEEQVTQEEAQEGDGGGSEAGEGSEAGGASEAGAGEGGEEERTGTRGSGRPNTARTRTATSRKSDKSDCYSEKMVEEIRKKAEIRAKRFEDPGNPNRKRVFQEHRLRIKTAKPFVDTSNPYSAKTLYYNPHYNFRLINFARIERENTIMLQHLANIIHGKGTVDNRLDPKKTKTCSNRGQERQIKLLNITFDNLNLLKRIQAQKPFYSRKEQLKDYGRQEKTMAQMSLYPLFWKLDKDCKNGAAGKARENAEANPFPRCCLTLGNSKQIFGKIVVELNAKECPITAENFRGLCTGEYGMSYKCSNIHRILPNLLWQGGDITGLNGYGSKSIYGDCFPDENFKLKHDKPGVISMANCGPNTNGSQFIITAKKLPVLDGTNVAFGKVISGMGVLKKLAKNVSSSGRPKETVYIIASSEMDPSEELSSDTETTEVDEVEGEGRGAPGDDNSEAGQPNEDETLSIETTETEETDNISNTTTI